MYCDNCNEEIKEGTTVFSTSEDVGVKRSREFPNVTNLGLSCATKLGVLPTELAEKVLLGEIV